MAFVAGVAIATQASMNAQLGVLVKNAVFATMVAFFSSFLFISIVLVFVTRTYPGMAVIKTVPHYLWFAGGLLSTFAVASFYWLIPKMGVGSMFSYALSGQLILAMVAGHFGWFNLPVTPITASKIIGAVCLIFGIVFMNNV